MRRIMAFTAALILICAAGVGVSAAQLDKASEQVAFTRRVESGDPAAAGDVELNIKTQYDRHLFWDTACRFDGADVQAQTEFSFSAFKRMESGKNAYGVELQTAIYAGMGDFDEPQEGLAAAYQELYRQCPPGEERSRVIYLKDYYTYYPLSGFLNYPDYIQHFDPTETYQTDAVKQISQAFADFFRILVVEDSQVEISVSRGEGPAQTTGVGMGKFAGDEFCLWTDSVYTDGACYFTLDAHTAQGALADFSQVPGGYGIYRLAAAQDDAGMLEAVKEMQMVYALDPEHTFLGLDLTPQQDALLLHTVENGMYTLTVIALDGMQTLQKLTVMPWPQDAGYYGWQSYISDEFIAIVLSEKTLSVISRDGEGAYQVEFTVAAGLANNAIRDSRYRNAMDFDGEKLAISGFLYDEEIYGENCGFYLAVYDRSGLLYYGEYRSSLDAFIEQLPYNQRCFPAENEAISVSFAN